MAHKSPLCQDGYVSCQRTFVMKHQAAILAAIVIKFASMKLGCLSATNALTALSRSFQTSRSTRSITPLATKMTSAPTLVHYDSQTCPYGMFFSIEIWSPVPSTHLVFLKISDSIGTHFCRSLTQTVSILIFSSPLTSLVLIMQPRGHGWLL